MFCTPDPCLTGSCCLGPGVCRDSTATDSFIPIDKEDCDNLDGTYKMVWMDSMSTTVYTETAMLDTNTMIMTSRGQHRDPLTGRVAVSTGEFDLSDPDKSVYTGYMSADDGSMFKSFTGVMRRVNP